MPLLTPLEHPATPGPSAFVAATRPRLRLGEELPIFCEKCGYSLHGLAQARCERCTILHYACPECNHHQPINTLRPAFQRILGRVRAFALAFWVFFKLNFFGWLLFAWFAMGMEWSYRTEWHHPTTQSTGPNLTMTGATFNTEIILPFVLFALPFGMMGRMLLLRWKRGWVVGMAMGAVVAGLVLAGAVARHAELLRYEGHIPPVSADFYGIALLTALVVLFGAVVVWPAWLAIVHLFLPQRTASALLDWQRAFSGKESSLARE